MGALLVRAVFMPMFIKNYGSALLGLPPAPFFLALVLLELPDTYVTTALGSTAKDLTSTLQGGKVQETSWRHIAITSAQVLLLLLLIGYLGVVAKRALDSRRAELDPESRYQLSPPITRTGSAQHRRTSSRGTSDDRHLNHNLRVV